MTIRCPHCGQVIDGLRLEEYAWWAPTTPWNRTPWKEPSEESPFWQAWAEGYRPSCSMSCQVKLTAIWRQWSMLTPEEQEAEVVLHLLETLPELGSEK